MGTCTEGHVGIDLDGDGICRLWQMAPVVNGQSVGNDDGLKTFLFPLLVPVAVFCRTHIQGGGRTFKGEILDYRIEGTHVEQFLLDVAQQACLRLFKGLKSSLASQCCQQVAGIGRVGGNREFYFEIFHNVVNF